MEDIAKCVEAYAEAAKCTYGFRLENGEAFTLSFADEHLFHLLGLHKLLDLEGFSGQKRKTQVIRRLMTGRLSHEHIAGSDFYPSIQSRIAYFPLVGELLHLETCNLIIDFDRTKVRPYSNIDAKYILFREVDGGIIHLTLAMDNQGELRPQTFLFERGRRYIDRQKKYRILEIKAVPYDKQ